MTLTQTLRLKAKFLQYDDMRALDYCEERWKEEGCPTERWQLVNFLERMLCELKRQGGYPKVLLLRKKELQRGTFTLLEPGREPEQQECCCVGGYRTGGRICPCPKGEPHRKQLRAWGMQI